jgi:MarR family 2-MHQ and catechol resistance regulon transcriptional repressor
MEETYSLGKSIEILTHRIEEFERRIIEKSDLSSLSPRQLYYLDEIYHLGQPTLTELAEKMKVSRPSVTIIIDKLVRKGYLRRIRSSHDRRSFHIHLTEIGMKLATLHDNIHYRFADIVQSILSREDIAALDNILQKVIRSLEERGPE